MANTVINTPELLNLDSTTGATVLAKGTVADRPEIPTFSLDYLVVAGGGGGYYSTNPGGGAGGLRTSYGSTSGGGEGAEPSLNVVSGTSFTVTVGAGGPKINASNVSNPSRGGNSVFGTITSLGGGVGVTGNDPDGIPWKNGGSGVGGRYGGFPGGQGTAGQGFRGGSINGAVDYKTGGSGGAGGVGLDATGSSTTGASGNGGPGLAVNILNATNAATASVGEVSGSDVYYAGGGGGGSDSFRNRPAGSGGLGGGGNGGYYSNGTNGTANTGGGGGGGANRPSTMEGGDGGSGVIILRYPNSVSATVNGATQASGSPFTEGNDKITVLTSGTGTITFTDSTPTNPDEHPINGTLRFNTDTNKTEYYDGTGWYEIVDEYASGFIGPATNYFDTKLYTGNGGTQSIGGYINGSASFGGNGYISGLPTVQNTSGEFSVSMWFNTTVNPSVQHTMLGGIKEQGTNDSVFALKMLNDGYSKLYLRGTDGTLHILADTVDAADGNWHHLVGTVSSSSGVFYVDGQQVDSATISNNITVDNLLIGAENNRATLSPTNYFNGSIDQVRIYNAVLSSADVTALYGETAATASTAAFPSGQTAIATYTMDTSANGLLNTQDLSTVNYPAGAGCLALYEMNGNVNDTSGTYNGTPTNITYEGGAFDQAAVFNGSSSKIVLPNDANIAPQNNFTISCWINCADVTQDSQIIWSMQAPTAGRVFLQLSSPTQGGDKALRIYTSLGSQNVTNQIESNTWYHLVFVKSSTDGVILYKNGSAIITRSSDTGDIALSTITATDTNRIGSYKTTAESNWFNGSIDQFRIFNTALTQSQVTTLARGIATSYSGTATNVNFNGHLDFAPGLVWIKARTVSASHSLQDTINGEGQSKNLYSDNTGYLGQYGVYGFLSAFGTNGFSVNVGSGSHTNANNQDYVSWNWKAGGTAVTNNDGTISSQVSANKDSGFSIVKYTGNGTAGATIGHGLSSAPELIIVKILNQANNWAVYNQDIGAANGLRLNSTSAAFSAGTGDGTNNYWNSTEPTSTVFTVGNGHSTNQSSSYNFIAYCFHSVAGYSKIGSYTGNGSSTGPIVYTTDDGTSGGSNGFEPKFIMIKRTDTSGYGWYMMDSARGMVGTTGKFLFANTSASEGTLGAGGLQPNSTGFQITDAGAGFNANLGTYIYMAFA